MRFREDITLKEMEVGECLIQAWKYDTRDKRCVWSEKGERKVKSSKLKWFKWRKGNDSPV